jgi:surfeit locus 1 family protein
LLNITQSLRWMPDWRINLLALLLLPVLLSLGFWQLDRADEKQQLQMQYQQRQQTGPIDIATIALEQDLSYQPVTLIGEYQTLPYTVLLDNKIYRGRFGYEIITAVKRTDTEQWVWVNRGWLAGDPTRQSLPDIAEISGSVAITGTVHVPQKTLLVLGDEVQYRGQWPRVVQSIDIAALADELGVAMFPFVVRIDPQQAGALQTDWPVTTVTPEKHIGYAVQWFAMALVLLLITVAANFKRSIK